MFVKFRQNFIKISKKNTTFNVFSMKFELNKLFKLFKNGRIVTTFLLKFWDLSGAKVWKSCRSRKSWKNEYLVAIVAVDTAENGPPKVWRNWIIYSVVSLLTMPAVDAAAKWNYAGRVFSFKAATKRYPCVLTCQNMLFARAWTTSPPVWALHLS